MEFTSTGIVFMALALSWFLWGVQKPAWDPFAPARLYGSLWFAAVGVTTLYWSDLQIRWTYWSWFCILGSVVSFLGGATLAGRSRPIITRTEDLRHPARIGFDAKRFLTAVSVLYAICVAGYMWRIYLLGSIPAFAENVEEARWAFYDIENGSFVDKLTGNLAFLLSTVIISCSLFFFVVEGKSLSRRVRLIAALLSGSAFVLLVLTTFRGALLSPLIVVCVLYHYVRRKFRVLTLVGATLVIGVLAIALVIYRHLTSPGFVLESTYSLAYMKLPIEYAPLADPYSTIALSMDNIVQLFEHGHTWSLGALTFRPLWTLLGLKGIFLEGVTLPFLPAYGFNTATYLFPFYEDFGTLGVFLFPFVFGLVAGKIYREMLVQKKLSYAVAYGFIVMLIFLSLMDNIFVFMKFWLELASIYAVLRYSSIEAKVQPLLAKMRGFIWSAQKCA